MALRGVAVLVVFSAVVFCNAGPAKSKEPPQPKVHVYAVPKFSMKPHSPGENRHYIFKEGSNITLTCETSFNKTNKNILINWLHPKVDNQYEVKQIHSHHDGMNIKERILHIKNARADDSGSYTCHTRSLHQKTWVSPNTFYIQVGEETKIKKVDVNQKIIKQQAKTTTTTLPTTTTTATKVPTTLPSTTKTSTAPVVTTTTSTTMSTTLPPKTQGPPPAPSKFDVGSFFGGMGLVAGVLLLLILIQVIIKKRRQESYGYLNM